MQSAKRKIRAGIPQSPIGDSSPFKGAERPRPTVDFIQFCSFCREDRNKQME